LGSKNPQYNDQEASVAQTAAISPAKNRTKAFVPAGSYFFADQPLLALDTFDIRSIFFTCRQKPPFAKGGGIREADDGGFSL
jgi:hypothetical protein